jgi:hypothetical protein
MHTFNPPNAPNPSKTAALQQGLNRDTAITQQQMNMVNQFTPYGNLVYSQDGSWSYVDPSTGKTITNPRYTSTQTLSPEQQHLLEQTNQFDAGANDIALAQEAKIADLLGTPFKYDPTEHMAWADQLYGSLNDKNNQQARDALATDLANKGINIGSDAYNSEMARLAEQQAYAKNNFDLNSYTTGQQTALTERNQPINETMALMNGQQLQQPNWVTTPQVGVNGVDIAGLRQANYQSQLGQYQGMMGGLGALGGTVLGGWASGGFGSPFA